MTFPTSCTFANCVPSIPLSSSLIMLYLVPLVNSCKFLQSEFPQSIKRKNTQYTNINKICKYLKRKKASITEGHYIRITKRSDITVLLAESWRNKYLIIYINIIITFQRNCDIIKKIFILISRVISISSINTEIEIITTKYVSYRIRNVLPKLR